MYNNIAERVNVTIIHVSFLRSLNIIGFANISKLAHIMHSYSVEISI